MRQRSDLPGSDSPAAVGAELELRAARAADAEATAAIYNEGIAAREATFETRLRRGADFLAQIGSPRHPLLVADLDGRVVGCAWTTPYSERECYAGVAECTVYVASELQGRGVGARLCEALAAEAERRGFHKLLGKLFATNEASIRLFGRCGFRTVGVHLRHGRLDGEWRDVIVVERLLGRQ
jgi:L-amino acid N-acyltransferase YncA